MIPTPAQQHDWPVLLTDNSSHVRKSIFLDALWRALHVWGWWAIARFDTQLDTYSSIRTIDKHKVASSGYFCILQLVLSLPSIYQHRISWLGGHSPPINHTTCYHKEYQPKQCESRTRRKKTHTPRSICRRTPHNPAYRTFYHSFFVNVSDALDLFAKCFVLWSRPTKALSRSYSGIFDRQKVPSLTGVRCLVSTAREEPCILSR